MKSGYEKRKNKRLDNSGFSLVELLIAVLIATIVGASIFGFMTVGAKTFNYNSADVNLQNEAQLTFNQMQDLIIDTSIGVQYFAKSGSLTEVSSDAEIGATDDKLLRLNNMDNVYDIWWDRDEEKLYYNEYVANYDDSTGEVTPGTQTVSDTDGLMSEYITGFSVDLSRLETSRVVRVDLTYEKGGRVQSTSHNITLRNQVVSGNKIEEKMRDAYNPPVDRELTPPKGKDIIYAEPNDDVNLTAVYDEDATGLTGYHVFDTEGNEVPSETNSLRYGFASGSTHRAGYTTIGYSDGRLHISKDETASEILVLVYCQSNNSLSKTVIVRVVRNNKLDLTFAEQTGVAADEVEETNNGSDIYSDDLKEDETFTLKATPDISWTKSKVLGEGESLCSSDQTKLDTIESRIKSQIYFKGGQGYGTLFSVDSSSSLNAGISPCKFKMANKYEFPNGVTQQPISVTAICGYSESKSINIQKEWVGNAYKKKADFHWGDSDVSRSKLNEISINNTGLTCKKGIAGDFTTNHVWLIDGSVTEKYYGELDADGNPKHSYPDFKTFVREEGGTTQKWRIPYTRNPNSEIIVDITPYISHAESGDGNSIHVLPYKNYNKDDAEYVGETKTYYFDRLRMTYSAKGDYSNVVFENVPGAPEGNHVTYYMRSFGKDLSATSGMGEKEVFQYGSRQNVANTVTLPIVYSSSFMPRKEGEEQTDETKAGQWLTATTWNMYEPSMNGDNVVWSEYSSGKINQITTNNTFDLNDKTHMFAYRTTYDGQTTIGFDLYTYSKNIDKNIAPRIRIYPVYKFNDQGVSFEEEIKDNYIDCVFWNIKVPFKSIGGKLFKVTELGNFYEACFFPGPEDKGFPGEKTSEARWYYAGYEKAANYNEKGKDYYDLYYTLNKNSNVDGSYQWVLNLYYHDVNGQSEIISTYKYNTISKLWEFSTN